MNKLNLLFNGLWIILIAGILSYFLFLSYKTNDTLGLVLTLFCIVSFFIELWVNRKKYSLAFIGKWGV